MEIRRFLAIAALVAGAAGCASVDEKEEHPLRVLMIGNSFSISCMSNLPKVAADLDEKLDLASLYIGGCSLSRHWSNVTNTAADFHPYLFSRNNCGETSESRMNVKRALEMTQWDVVTIQQSSSQSWDAMTYEPFAGNLIGFVRQYAPQAKINVQETWSYTPWDKRLLKWHLDQNSMYERLHVAYAKLAERYSLPIIPMGTAVQEWRRQLPVRYTENSYGGDVVGGRRQAPKDHFKRNLQNRWEPNSDKFHLNEKGEYFQAVVWAAKLFDSDLKKLKYRPKDITEKEQKLMVKIAREVK